MPAGPARPRRTGNDWPDAARNDFLVRHHRLLRWAAARAARRAPGLGYEDAVSAVAVLAVERFGEFDPGRGSFSTWLTFLARTAAHDHRRAERARPAQVGRPAAPGPGPSDLAAGAELSRRVAGAVAQLPAAEAAAVAARFGLDGGGGRTLREVDPRVTRERNRQRIARGLRRLSGLLPEYNPAVRPRRDQRPHPDFPVGTAVRVRPPGPGARPAELRLVGRVGTVAHSARTFVRVEFPGEAGGEHFPPGQLARVTGAAAGDPPADPTGPV